MADRPTAAFVLSLIGGIITLILGSIAGAGFAAGLFGLGTASLSVAIGAAIIFLVVGLICGILIIVGAVLQYSEDKSRVRTGSIVVLVFTLVGIPFTFFGLIIGGIMSIIGAVLGFTWKPSTMVMPPAQPTITRICPNCGRVVAEDTKFCPNCGKSLP
ncbi:MAG: zinc ribbon domain-containing protein [Thaumarchaeota archaeon]|nr:zinc ribbon domain-containing protein [Nitrososphaerota archaeon]